MDLYSLDALLDDCLDPEDAEELADLLIDGKRRVRLSGADLAMQAEAAYNGTDPDDF